MTSSGRGHGQPDRQLQQWGGSPEGGTTSAGRFDVLVLGPFQLARDGVEIDTARWQPNVVSLLKLLALALHQGRRREELMDVFWPEGAPDAAASNLRSAVHLLRRGLGGGDPSPVLADRGWLRLNPAFDWNVDVHRFEALLAGDRNSPDRLAEAVDLFRGEPFLEDRYAEWASPTRDRLQQQWRDACVLLAQRLLNTGDLDGAYDLSERVLSTDPFAEDALRLMLRVLNRMGKRLQALRRYRQFEHFLQVEMGIAPTAETAELVAGFTVPRELSRSSDHPRANNTTVMGGEAATDTPSLGTRATTPVPYGGGAASGSKLSTRLGVWNLHLRLSRTVLVGLILATLAVPIIVLTTAGKGLLQGTASPDVVIVRQPAAVWTQVQAMAPHLRTPSGVAINDRGQVYIADMQTNSIHVLSAAGDQVDEWRLGGDLAGPTGIALNRRGELYVADSRHNRIVKLSARGHILSTIGGPGSSLGQFSLPQAVTVDQRGFIYVADTGNDRVQKLSPSGRVRSVWGGIVRGLPRFDNPDGIAVSPQGYVYVVDQGADRVEKLSSTGKTMLTWGGKGSAAGQFSAPRMASIDAHSNIYVVDTGNHRIQEFSPDGRLLRIWPRGGSHASPRFGYPIGIAANVHGAAVITDATSGTAYMLSSTGSVRPLGSRSSPVSSRFRHPAGIAIDRRGNVYVADTGNNCVWKLSSTGHALLQLGSGDTPFHHLTRPEAVAADAKEDIFVADSGNNRVVKYSPTGAWIASWGMTGTQPDQFLDPSALTNDASGNVYVADWGNDRIQKFSSSGTLLGVRAGVRAPRGIATGSNGTVYVASTGDSRIEVLSDTGKKLESWGGLGEAPGRFQFAQGLAVDQTGHVFVADWGNDRVQELSPGGLALKVWGTEGPEPNQFANPSGIAIDRSDNIYVADTGNNRILKFVPSQ